MRRICITATGWHRSAGLRKVTCLCRSGSKYPQTKKSSQRLHSALGYQTTVAFEQQLLRAKNEASTETSWARELTVPSPHSRAYNLARETTVSSFFVSLQGVALQSRYSLRSYFKNNTIVISST